MSLKISELPSLILANLVATANTAVPVVSDIEGGLVTYQTTAANLKSYVETDFTGTGTFSAAGIATFNSNVVVLGNLSVQGTTTTTSSQNLSTNASLIEMHTFDSNLNPWTTNDGRDIGLRMFYYGTSANTAALYRESSNGFLTWVGAGAGNVSGNISTSATFGTMQLGAVWIANTTPTTGARTGALQVNGGAYISGNIWSYESITNLGDSYTQGNVTTGGLLAMNASVLGSTLSVAGSTTVNALTVNNSGSFGTTLVTAGNATINGLTVNNSSTMTTLGVSGNIVSGNLSTGALTASNLTTSNLTTSNLTSSNLTTSNLTSTNVTVTTLYTGNIYPTTSNVSNIGSISSQYHTVFAVATAAQYADLAEKYEADADYGPGTVVVFGGEKEITVTTNFADNRVAGIISTDPAYLMNSQSIGLPVALRGKVPVKVVGAVAKGDLLVTSTVAGHAESLNFNKPEPYTVVAKSLEDSRATESRTIIAVVL